MVSNFRKGFIFPFFASQEPFVKIKTAKFFVVHVQSEQSILLGTIYIVANRRMSASVPLTAIAEATQKIKVPYVSTDARTRQRRKTVSGSNRF